MTQDDRTAEIDEPYEPSTQDQDSGNEAQSDEVPNPDTGVGIGMGTEPTSFEPEEDPDAAGAADQESAAQS